MNKLYSRIKNLFSKRNNRMEYQEEEYDHIMTDEEFVKFHDDRLAELDPEIVKKAVDVLSSELSTMMDETKKLYKNDPVHWMSPYHFYEGMFIRNLLRDKVCLDDKLTTREEYQNWDNFYVQLMEIAAGCREYEFVE